MFGNSVIIDSSNNTKGELIGLKKNDQLSKIKSFNYDELLTQIRFSEFQFRDTLNFPFDLTFGMEIEFEKALYKEVSSHFSSLVDTTSDNCWILKKDSTVMTSNKTRGGEITTPIMKDTRNNWNDLAKVCKMLQECGAETKEKCGGHIHFGAHIMNSDINYWINLIKLWIIYEKVIFRFSTGDKSRMRNGIMEYAYPVSKYLFDLLPRLEKYTDYHRFCCYLPRNKNQAINFCNVISSSYETKNTIEFRCPNGTINELIWQNNINFFSRLLLYCASANFDLDFIDYKLGYYSKMDYNFPSYNKVELSEALELADLIFSNNLDKLCFLRQYLKDVQNIHYKTYTTSSIKL